MHSGILTADLEFTFLCKQDQATSSTVEMLSPQEGVQTLTPVMSSAGIHSGNEDTEGEMSLVISIPRQL